MIERIGKLAIPPAGTQVWICPSPLGHVQATGRDAKRRKQYRYLSSICRKSYVHPAVIDQYTSDELSATFRRATLNARRRPVRGSRQPESVALRWLEALPAAL